jgi:osmotically-inducible protein OsmY
MTSMESIIKAEKSFAGERFQESKETIMKSDTEIRRNVETELQWDPSVDGSKIGVIVKDGVVTLNGEASHFVEKWAAEDVAKRICGVRAIANEIQILIPASGVRSDADIAAAAANALRWHVATAAYEITPVVANGWVTLTGKVQWGFQKNAAQAAVAHLLGVKGVSNDIQVKSAVKAADVKQKIEEAFKRHAILDSDDIRVNVDRATVTLDGHVHTWREHEDAARAAWAAPGVANVENRLSIQY